MQLSGMRGYMGWGQAFLPLWGQQEGEIAGRGVSRLFHFYQRIILTGGLYKIYVQRDAGLPEKFERWGCEAAGLKVSAFLAVNL